MAEVHASGISYCRHILNCIQTSTVTQIESCKNDHAELYVRLKGSDDTPTPVPLSPPPPPVHTQPTCPPVHPSVINVEMVALRVPATGRKVIIEQS